MEKSLTSKMTRLVFRTEYVQGYIMLNLLLLEAILYLYIFSPVLQFHWSKTTE